MEIKKPIQIAPGVVNVPLTLEQRVTNLEKKQAEDHNSLVQRIIKKLGPYF